MVVTKQTKQEAQLSLGKADHMITSEAQRPTSSHGQKEICQMWHSSMHTMLMECYLESYNEC